VKKVDKVFYLLLQTMAISGTLTVRWTVH